MFRPRIIPCLLLKDNGLVKTVNFKRPEYIGDPINTVRIFNDLKADELMFLDIEASIKNKQMPLDIIKKIGEETFMPFTVGGGIKDIGQIKKILGSGAEKVSINTAAILNPNLINNASETFGSQAIIVSIDVKKHNEDYKVYINGGRIETNVNLIEYVKKIEKLGAGEILLNSIDKDGIMEGYDINLLSLVSKNLSIPLIALGGAGKLEDFSDAISVGGASAAAAGSYFVYSGKSRGILINYDKEEIDNFFYKDKLS